MPIYVYYSKIPLKTRKRIRQVFYSLVGLPVTSNIYRGLYYRQIARRASRGLSRVEIEGHNLCNLGCIMCPYDLMTRERTLMTMDVFEKIIGEAAEIGVEEVVLNFYNEPFLDPLLFERIAYVRSRGMRSILYSNGTLVTERKIDAVLESGLDYIVFSFDGGTKETYEETRAGANFEKTRENIVSLIKERNSRRRRKPCVLIHFVAQKSNYHAVQAFTSFWQGLADGVNVKEVDNRKMESLLPDELKRKDKPRYLYPCRRLFNSMTVMSNGQVALCCRDFDGSVILGDLKSQTISEVYASPMWENLRQTHLNGDAERVELCRKIECPEIYRDGAYLWWVS